ncbi:MAG TPA: antibiotic biosynthesis monooxygenase family protein [Cytophagales bacterium]|nr:antibiotic biosynthesis monooxygenase family protein [Cytophagales bacterium]
MIVRIVKMTFKEENINDFIKLFEESGSKIAGMKGCSHLELMKDPTNTSIFFTYSMWDTEEDLNNYRKSETFKNIWGKCKKYFAAKAEAFSMETLLKVKC